MQMQNGKIEIDSFMMKQYSFMLNVENSVDTLKKEKYINPPLSDEELAQMTHYRSQIDAIEAYRAGLLHEAEFFVCDDNVQLIISDNNGDIKFLYRV